MSMSPKNIFLFHPNDHTASSLPGSFCELKKITTSSESFFEEVQSFLDDEELKNLRGPAAAEVADFLDELITKVLKGEPLHKNRYDMITAMRSPRGSWGGLPASCTLQGEGKVSGENLVNSKIYTGRRARRLGGPQIWKGIWGDEDIGAKVMNIPPNYASHPELGGEQFAKVLVRWRCLEHRNLLSPYGIYASTDRDGSNHTQLWLVWPWMKNEGILVFIRDNPEFNRFGMLVDACEALIYLHSQGFVHGGLNRDNVLVDLEKRARLANFCFDGILGIEDQVSLSNPSAVYMAPELILKLFPEHRINGVSQAEKPADVYALGVLIFEALVGKEPFDMTERVTSFFSRGSTKLPSGLPNPNHDIWNLVERCWKNEPDGRPQLNEIRDVLKECGSKWDSDWKPLLQAQPATRVTPHE